MSKRPDLADEPGVQVFLCHSSADRTQAEKLARSLQSARIRVWYDDWEIEYGDGIAAKIEEGIASSDYLAILLTPRSVRSEWVRHEWTTAYYSEVKWQSIRVLPVLVEDCEVPALLEARRHVDLRGGRWAPNLRRLKKWLTYTAATLPESTRLDGADASPLGRKDVRRKTAHSAKKRKPITCRAGYSLKGRWGSNSEAAELADAFIGRLNAILLRHYPLAALTESDDGVTFPFGRLGSTVEKGEARIELAIHEGCELEFLDAVTAMETRHDIRWVQYLFPFAPAVESVLAGLRQKGIEPDYVRHEAVEFATRAGSIRCERWEGGASIRYSIPRYSGLAEKLPEADELLDLVLGSLSRADFEAAHSYP